MRVNTSFGTIDTLYQNSASFLALINVNISLVHAGPNHVVRHLILVPYIFVLDGTFY